MASPLATLPKGIALQFNIRHLSRLSTGILPLFLLGGCVRPVPKAQCQQIRAVTDQARTQVRVFIEENTENSPYNPTLEQHLAQTYFGASRTIETLDLSNQTLKTLQIELVETYQEVSDYRFQSVELMALGERLTAAQAQQITTLHQQADETLAVTMQRLNEVCPED